MNWVVGGHKRRALRSPACSAWSLVRRSAGNARGHMSHYAPARIYERELRNEQRKRPSREMFVQVVMEGCRRPASSIAT